MNLKEFVEKYGSALTQKIEQNMTPLYNPLVPDEMQWVEEKLNTLLKKPFPVQAEIIKGLSKALYKTGRKRLLISGEMGVGKTVLALSTVAVSDKPMRVLVVCPGHLVKKWIREAKETIPGVKVVDLAVKNVIGILNSLRMDKTLPSTHELYVISKKRCKLSYGWRAAALPGKLVTIDGKIKRSPIPRCPRCGSSAIEDDKYLSFEILSKKRVCCQVCGEALWQADNKLHRYAPAEFIKKYLKGFFDLVVIDEVHDYKAGDSLQGNAMGAGTVCVRENLMSNGNP